MISYQRDRPAAIKKNRPDQILIPIVGVSMVGIAAATTACKNLLIFISINAPEIHSGHQACHIKEQVLC